ncbi:hypothetical protein MNBD_PLANCTO03-228 [hydrothermal vent metagenome]|uniref:Integration host factor beta subunit n=1 Tax=hydrothermal vent metagenome TaxID=652676 RepID=A0A3B1E043_9ZZZZ
MGHDGVRTITKKELSEQIADKTGQSRAAVRLVIQALLDEVVEELSRGNRIEFRGFGVFETKTRAPRIARNPQTRLQVLVPERRSAKFKPGKGMRDAIERDQAPPRPLAPAEPMPEPKAAVTPDTSSIGDAMPIRP